MSKLIGIALTILLLIETSEATAPLFLQAITSALATIPLSGGPMTTGLIGAKLGIGTKLLYYLGYFGRSSKPKAASRPKAVPKPTPPKPAKVAPQFPSGLQPVPLPYAALAGSRGFQQMGGMGGGFGGPGGFQQMPFGGFDPSQIFQALRAQGYDANTAMQLMNYGGGFGMNAAGSGFNPNAANFPSNAGGGGFGMNTAGGGFDPNVANFPSNVGGGGFGMNTAGGGFDPNAANFPSNGGGGFGMNTAGGGFDPNTAGFPSVGGGGFDPSTGSFTGSTPEGGSFPPGFPEDSEQTAETSEQSSGKTDVGGTEDIESFFTFLQDMDDNGCISRLICDIGGDPSFLGEFSENIHGMVGSLDVQPTSRAYPYIQIMENGKQGGCDSTFPQCSESAYEVVKSIAPSVGIPQNIEAAAINNL